MMVQIGTFNTETIAKYLNKIKDSENFEFLMIFGVEIPYSASHSVQIECK